MWCCASDELRGVLRVLRVLRLLRVVRVLRVLRGVVVCCVDVACHTMRILCCVWYARPACVLCVM